MKKIILFTLLFIFFQGVIVGQTIAEKETPAYAKWGTIAVTETIKKYPFADVVDYLHIGREDQDDTIAVEKFKLWLRHGEKEFGVFVDVKFDKRTNQFKEISFKETPR